MDVSGILRRVRLAVPKDSRLRWAFPLGVAMKS